MRKLLNILKNYKGVIFDTDVLLKLAKQKDKNGTPSLDKFLDLMKKEKISVYYPTSVESQELQKDPEKSYIKKLREQNMIQNITSCNRRVKQELSKYPLDFGELELYSIATHNDLVVLSDDGFPAFAYLAYKIKKRHPEEWPYKLETYLTQNDYKFREMIALDTNLHKDAEVIPIVCSTLIFELLKIPRPNNSPREPQEDRRYYRAYDIITERISFVSHIALNSEKEWGKQIVPEKGKTQDLRPFYLNLGRILSGKFRCMCDGELIDLGLYAKSTTRKRAIPSMVVLENGEWKYHYIFVRVIERYIIEKLWGEAKLSLCRIAKLYPTLHKYGPPRAEEVNNEVVKNSGLPLVDCKKLKDITEDFVKKIATFGREYGVYDIKRRKYKDK